MTYSSTAELDETFAGGKLGLRLDGVAMADFDCASAGSDDSRFLRLGDCEGHS